MINLYSAHIESLSVHRIGNKVRGESFILSDSPIVLDEEMHSIFKDYFLKPFREKEVCYYSFCHDVSLDMHDLYIMVQSLFSFPADGHVISKKIAGLLFDRSNHPHIKGGEVYVVRFSDLVINNERVNGVGIFKSELKHDFIRFEQEDKKVRLEILQGVNTSKLDKGCLVFQVDEDDGYKVLSVDTNRYDTKYWIEDFLGIEQKKDDKFFTKNYLKLCQNFAKDVILPAEDKRQEVLFLNRAVDHFAKNDRFEETNFLNDVIENPNLVPDFKVYKQEKGEKYNIEDVSSFPISNTVLSGIRKSIKSTVDLDTNMRIKMDFVSAESMEKFVEKGWDEERQMYYYLLYFNREQKK